VVIRIRNAAMNAIRIPMMNAAKGWRMVRDFWGDSPGDNCTPGFNETTNANNANRIATHTISITR
jgi:hypothetical protein